MNNITIEKGIHEIDLIELNVFVESEYANVKQYCYVDKYMLENAANNIQKFINTLEPAYIEFGHKDGNYTPAFSIEIEKKDSLGHVRLELDLEINDNDERKHRCQLYLFCDLGELKKFGNAISNLIFKDSVEPIKLL